MATIPAATTHVIEQAQQGSPATLGKAEATTFEEPRPIARDFDFKLVKIQEVAKHNCVRATPTTSVAEALRSMKKNRVSSLLIYDKSVRKYIGAVNCFALMGYIAFGDFKKFLIKGDLEKLSYEKMPISELMPLSKETEYMWTYDPDTDLEAVLEPLSKGIHRVTMNKVKGNPNKRKLLSQRDVFEYLYKWCDTQKVAGRKIPLLDANVRELNFANQSQVITVSEETPAIEAFQKMYNADIQAVGITNETGAIVGNLSVSDLRNLTMNYKLPFVFLPVLLFQREINGREPPLPVVVSTKDTLWEVMGKLLHTNYKRVWIIDNNLPIGVITLTDIITKFAQQDVTLAKR